MKDNLLTWNFANCLTIWLMFAVLYFLLVFAARATQAKKGAA